MVKISLEYEGQLHCKTVHEPSGTVLFTDAPKDNQGLGESFSPTDLVATGLASCILTTMAIQARTLGIDMDGATATVEKEMSAAPPRKIARLAVKVQITKPVDELNRVKLERAAHTCPVHRSLHPEVDAPIEISWA
ncbi:MAG: OsmC family protein [Acidobacteriaceae bacterium]|nr:OsmC family protein [Acidobacteriaceae bacterium]